MVARNAAFSYATGRPVSIVGPMVGQARTVRA